MSVFLLQHLSSRSVSETNNTVGVTEIEPSIELRTFLNFPCNFIRGAITQNIQSIHFPHFQIHTTFQKLLVLSKNFRFSSPSVTFAFHNIQLP